MSRTSGLTRRLGVAVSALGLVALAAAPVTALTPAKDSVDCIDYGDVATAPKGSIPRDDLHIVKKDVLAKGAKGTGRGVSAAAFAPAVIPVRFHVIQKDNGNGGGNLSDARIAAQIQVLNDAYAGSGFSFVLEQTTHTTQPEWFNLIGANGGDPRYFRGSGKEIKMKQALYGDSDSETLNIYSASLGQSLLGWAYFPSNFDSEFTGGNPLPTYFDGVVVDFRSLPTVPNDTGDSRAYEVYGAGDTATHEVGHWLGLYHTFQGGCRARRRLRRRHGRRRRRRPSRARSGATPARVAASTRSTTSWTTPTTSACTSSPRASGPGCRTSGRSSATCPEASHRPRTPVTSADG